MKCYLSFSDEDVFKVVALLEEAPIIPPKEVAPRGAQPTPANIPVKEAAVDTTMEPTAEKRPLNKFPGWEKLLDPSRPIVAARQIPPLWKGPRWRPYSWRLGEGLVQIPQTEEPRVSTTQSESPCPMKELGVTQWMMLPPGFAGVTVCLQRDQPPEGVSDPDSLRMAIVSGPSIATMSASHIVKDEVTGVTYMDTMTT